MANCDCELRNRQWNPLTGRCETCGSKYHAAKPASTNILDNMSDEKLAAARDRILKLSARVKELEEAMRERDEEDAKGPIL